MLDEYIISKTGNDPERTQEALDIVLRLITIYPIEYLRALSSENIAIYFKSIEASKIVEIFDEGRKMRDFYSSTGLFISDESVKPEFVSFDPVRMEQTMSPAELALRVRQWHERFMDERNKSDNSNNFRYLY